MQRATKQTKKAGKVVGKGNPDSILIDLPASSATLESDTGNLKKIKINLPCDPAISLPTCPKDSTSYFTDTCSAIFMVTLSTIARKWRQPKCPPAHKWVMKMCYTYTMQ